ncbi:MAG: DUF4321 domain-containing protein [Oscillospiraceae bacterium]
MKVKKTVTFLFFLVAGVILGSLVANLTADISFLKWLSFGKWVGIPVSSPFILDLALLKISMGFEIGVNIAQIIFITIGMFLYRLIAGRL